ncbi:MAG: galactose mutarotase [Acidobacteria bacterium]|nr:galactose mutarotase [Acidobacteriota bacterium]
MTLLKLAGIFMIASFAIFLAMLLPASGSQEPDPHKESFGSTPDGKPVDVYTFTNAHRIEVRVINYGGIITALRVPDRNGKLDDIVLGFDNLAGYLNNKPYFGAIIGRYANRIANGKFSLDGRDYTLAKNNGPNSLHGGSRGFNNVLWRADPFRNRQGRGVILSYLSKDGEEGYPGNLDVKVTYTLSDANELLVDYLATADKATPINLTQHTYFNLGGEGNGDVLAEELRLNADRFTPIDKDLIPTGEIRSVKGTPLDFTQSTRIGARINDPYDQLLFAHGYDHNFVLKAAEGRLQLAARVHEPNRGRVLEVSTTQPGIQFYSANFLDGTLVGKHGHRYKQREAFCLETQHFPDSPNHANFPSTILRPGKTFHSRTVFKFSVQ